MPDACSFRQVEEKHVSAEVELMVWSPRMDLLALANVQGEVVLHRLSWQKVWTLAPPGEETRVTALSWRPDGKVLSVGYSSGKVVLCDVENAANLHTLEMKAAVTSSTWITEVNQGHTQETVKPYFQENAHLFLPKLPQFPKSYSALGKGQSEESVEDSKKLKSQTDLNILVIGTEDGHVYLYAYGIFPTGVVDLSCHGAGKSGLVLSGLLSSDLLMMSLLVKVLREDGETQDVDWISFETTLLASRHVELRVLALKFGQVLTLMMYLDSTIQQMTEAWEDILLEMDSKLMKFAEEKKKISSGTVSNDFLRLLMFGTPSDELQGFLLHELTDRGLKKLGHSIETSYSNIQKLVLKHLQSVGQAVVYHLADILGMAHWFNKFGVLGLSEEEVQAAITAAGSFMLKASELQQVIDGSIKNFKAFFRWLYVVMKGLSDEPVPPELTKMTQQDLNFVAQFLKENFTEEVEGSKSGFKLEKVGQYLKMEDLSDPPDTSGNPWVSFLEENPDIQSSSMLFPAERNKSLIQMHAALKDSISDALNRCALVIGQSLECVSTASLFQVGDIKDVSSLRISQFSKTIEDTTYMYCAFIASAPPAQKCYLLRQATQDERKLELSCLMCAELGFPDADHSIDGVKCSEHLFHDVSFYSSETLSVLLAEDAGDFTPVLAQVPLALLEEAGFCPISASHEPAIEQDDIPCTDIGPLIDSLNQRRLENMKASKFAVSGTRNVSCVLFASRRRVRLFLMDAGDEEDDDEDDDEVNQTQDISNTATNTDDDDEDKENSRESAMDGL